MKKLERTILSSKKFELNQMNAVKGGALPVVAMKLTKTYSYNGTGHLDTSQSGGTFTMSLD